MYVGGFFSKSLDKKVVGLDYYIAMGSAAYNSVSSLSSASQMESLYKKLAEEFDLLIYLLNQMAKEKPHKVKPKFYLSSIETYFLSVSPVYIWRGRPILIVGDSIISFH